MKVDETLINVGKLAGAVIAIIGAWKLVFLPIIMWNKRRIERRDAIINKMNDLCKGQEELSERMEEIVVDEKARHERLESKIDDIYSTSRLALSSSVAGLNALMQHDVGINGNVKRLHDKLQDRIIEGIGG